MHRMLHAFIIHFRWEDRPFDLELIERCIHSSEIILI